jgi:type II secretion system protein H
MTSRFFQRGVRPPRRFLRGVAAAPPQLSPSAGCDQGFTLIELLLVLALLSIIISVSMPSLSGFFRGRTLDSEARRLLSLTRMGQSRAVSEGIPVLLWVDAEQRAYGAEQEKGWDERDARAVECKLDKDLSIEVVRTNPPSTRFSLQIPNNNKPGQTDPRANLPRIKFLPDGSIEETSPLTLILSDTSGSKLLVTQSRTRLHYEITRNTN